MKTQRKFPGKLLQAPCVLFLMMIGFILEFLIELPFAVMCAIEKRFGRTAT